MKHLKIQQDIDHRSVISENEQISTEGIASIIDWFKYRERELWTLKYSREMLSAMSLPDFTGESTIEIASIDNFDNFKRLIESINQTIDVIREYENNRESKIVDFLHFFSKFINDPFYGDYGLYKDLNQKRASRIDSKKLPNFIKKVEDSKASTTIQYSTFYDKQGIMYLKECKLNSTILKPIDKDDIYYFFRPITSIRFYDDSLKKKNKIKIKQGDLENMRQLLVTTSKLILNLEDLVYSFYKDPRIIHAEKAVQWYIKKNNINIENNEGDEETYTDDKYLEGHLNTINALYGIINGGEYHKFIYSLMRTYLYIVNSYVRLVRECRK